MLVAKIKGKKRHEIRKVVISKKGFFTYLGCTYHIRPEAIYNYTVFGIFTCRAIDYVEGNGEPINYYVSHFERPPERKNLDTISMVVNRWLQGRFLHFQLIVLIMLIVLAVLGGLNVAIGLGLIK